MSTLSGVGLRVGAARAGQLDLAALESSLVKVSSVRGAAARSSEAAGAAVLGIGVGTEARMEGGGRAGEGRVDVAACQVYPAIRLTAVG